MTQNCDAISKVYNFRAYMLRIITNYHTKISLNISRVIPLFYILLPFTFKILPVKPSVWHTVQQL